MTQPDPPRPPHGQHYAPPAVAPRRRRKWPFVVGGIVLLLVLVGIAGGNNAPAPTAPAAPAASAAAEPGADATSGTSVVYEVTGKGTASVTYSKEGFSQEQQNGVRLPYRKELMFSAAPVTPALTVVAQHSTGGGDITCRITVDGTVVGESTSSGQYAVVTCNGNG